MNEKKSREINERVEYGLTAVDSDRTLNMSLKDFLYTYKAIQEFRRFFHQPRHYPTLVDLNLFLGNIRSGAFSILNELELKTLDKYLPKDVIEEIENGDQLTHPGYPFYYHLKKDEKFKLSAAGNTEPPAFELIKEMGFEVSKEDGMWVAENYIVRFNASSPLELLGLVTLYQAKGENWSVSDDKIDEYVKLDEK